MAVSVVWTYRQNGLTGAPGKVKSAISGVFRSNASAVLSDMQRRTPVDTGELRASETATSDDTSLTVRATAEHAAYVHFGTRYMSPRPFMQDALDAAVPTVLSDLTDAIGKALS